jgi:pyruvate/2-oxoglutarate dehydrogenase complex dihydrolipoamide acyltransferase (E2) component
MTPSSAKVIVVHVGHVIGAKATDAASAEASDVTSTKAAHMASTKTAHVASAKATHATHVASAAASAAARLCTRGNKAAGKQCACQNHHRSSSHNILRLDGRTFRHRALSDVGAFQRSKRQRRDGLDMGIAILPPD